MFEALTKIIISILETISYPGIFFLMALESMIALIPSELVMPFVGFLVQAQKISLFWAIFLSSLGTLCGSLLSYFLGRKYGILFIKKLGRYLLLNESHLNLAENFFQKKGEKTIFISRFIPIVRHVISIPAGIGKMKLPKFIFYTLLGGTIWNGILLWLGYKLSEQWMIISYYSSQIDIFILVGIGVLLLYYFYKILKKRRKNQ